MRKLCPHCFNFINLKKGEVECPICHHEVVKKKEKREEIKTSYTEAPKEEISIGEILAKEREQKDVESSNESEVITKPEEPKEMYHQKNGRVKWVSKRVREGKVKAPKKVTNPRVSGVHIDVESSSYFAKSKNKYTPSAERIVIENNGKYELEKLQWWEIYRWADRQLAKNKIKKVVRKEAVKRPERVSLWVLFSLCLFSGFLGVHNFYAGNIKRGLVSSICFTVAMVFVAFLDKIPFFNMYFQGLLCALPGLICILIWFVDTISIIFKRFKYNTSRMNYIKTLDIETRARLGKKYIYIV